MAQPEKSSIGANNRPELGDSWIVDSGDSGESSAYQSSDSSNIDISKSKVPVQNLGETNASARVLQETSATHPAKHSPRVLRKSVVRSGSVGGKSTLTSSGSPRRGRPKKSMAIGSEPELIMPSIHEETMGRSRPEIRKRRNPQPISPVRTRGDSPSRDTNIKALQAAEGFVKAAFEWVFDIIGGALGYAKTPLSYALAIYLLVGLMVITRNVLTNSIYSALSPICRIPGASLLHLDMCQFPVSANKGDDTIPVVEFVRLMETQAKFEEILEQTAEGVTLPMDMKRSEASIRDLRQMVIYSNLPSKDELLYEFGTFIKTSATASDDLLSFSARVGGSVDKMLSMAKHTKRVLEGMAEREATQGAVTSFLNSKIIAPFMPFRFTDNQLHDQYIMHTQGVAREVDRLIDDGMALQLTLRYLEDQLDNIYGISVRDNNKAQYSRDQILSQLWTMLGGNRSKLNKFDTELKLLEKVNTYRQSASGYVSGTLLKLQAIRSELEVMRETVGSGQVENVPLSVHIDTVQRGLERLQLGKDQTNKVLAGNILERAGRLPQQNSEPTIVKTTPIDSRPHR
ncbi:hypothetical protein MMC26_000331 [Xylographa opegraphella]|nr:hypothetical protein [Xylographa opegraphella]